MSDTGSRAKLWDMIKDIDIAMMTTVDEDGSLSSRPMATKQSAFDGALWFFTRAHSPKVDDVAHEKHVNLAYADTRSQNYVSVSGKATVVKDQAKAREMWDSFAATWFPKGVDDPELALIRVDVDQAEYWDGSSKTMMLLYGLPKAKLTGKPPTELGENRKVNLA